MDQDTVVNEQTESGRRLIEALPAAGFEVRLAFWAKPTETGQWFLYLASPIVDEEGPAVGYRRVLATLQNAPDVWIDPFEIKVIGVKDSLAEKVLAAMELKSPNSPYAARRPRPYPGMTRLGELALGGISYEGVSVYPLQQETPD